MTTKTQFPQQSSAYKQAAPLADYDWSKPIGNVFFVNSNTGTDAVGFGFSPASPLRHSLATRVSSLRTT